MQLEIIILERSRKTDAEYFLSFVNRLCACVCMCVRECAHVHKKKNSETCA